MWWEFALGYMLKGLGEQLDEDGGEKMEFQEIKMSIRVIVWSLQYLNMASFSLSSKMDEKFIGMFVLTVFAKSGLKEWKTWTLFLIFWKNVKPLE